MDTAGVILWSIFGILLIWLLIERRRYGDPDYQNAKRKAVSKLREEQPGQRRQAFKG